MKPGTGILFSAFTAQDVSPTYNFNTNKSTFLCTFTIRFQSFTLISGSQDKKSE